MKLMKILTALALVAAMAVPAGALAQADEEGYGDDSSTILPSLQDGSDDDGSDNGSTPRATNADDALPFTGSELGVLAGTGGSLVLLGFGLRRMTFRTGRV
jgi:hypothetical protein